MTLLRHTATGLAAVILAAAGCSASTSAEHTVIFEVTGPATADITSGIGTDQSQESGATLPWKKEQKVTTEVLITVLLAQNKGAGDISCKITVDGKVVKENKSSGEFAIVTCSNG